MFTAKSSLLKTILLLIAHITIRAGGEETIIDGSVSNLHDATRNIADSNLEIQSNELLSRNKRFLIFPVQTLLQFSLCYVSPADIKRNIYVNQGFQLNWLLPNETHQLPSTFFVVPPVITVGRSRDKRDDENAAYNNMMYEEMIQTFNDVSTEQIYYVIQVLMDNNGYNGTGCLLHSICQMSTIPLHQDGDLFHEILQFILTPSEHSHVNDDNTTSKQAISGYTTMKNPTPIEEYHRAESLGRSYEGDYSVNHCDQYYSCPNSPLDKITHVIFDDL